ncbi:MAG: dCTP deaminase, partial [Actinomycetota bacterium]|nr:dCTP deaminase [Actinomycetota bacterium]
MSYTRRKRAESYCELGSTFGVSNSGRQRHRTAKIESSCAVMNTGSRTPVAIWRRVSPYGYLGRLFATGSGSEGLESNRRSGCSDGSLVDFSVAERRTPLILSDRDIFEAIASSRIGIEPFDKADLQPSSVDLHVDRFFRTFHNARYPFIDVKKPMEDLTELIEVDDAEAFILHPGEFVLGSTSEYVRLPNDLVARLEGKSSLGRLGLLIHSTAGYVDPGFEGHLTLELSNVANLPITIYPLMKIGQISFFQLTSEAENPYGTK